MSILIEVTEPGKGRKVNPYTDDVLNELVFSSVRYAEFEANNPIRYCIDSERQPLQVGRYEANEVWQYRSWDKKNDWWGEWKETNEIHAKSIFNADNSTRIIYQSIEAAVKPENICMVCDEDRTGKTFCADCGLNVADEKQYTPANEAKESVEHTSEISQIELREMASKHCYMIDFEKYKYTQLQLARDTYENGFRDGLAYHTQFTAQNDKQVVEVEKVIDLLNNHKFERLLPSKLQEIINQLNNLNKA